jgi:hypothetical protein
MPSVKLSPLFNDAQLDNNGLPLSGGMVYWYLAGTTTPTIVYSESSGSVANTNPVLLNTRGEPVNPIWLQAGQTYKAILNDSLGNLIRTIDNISGVNDTTTPVISEWVLYAGAATYISGTSFSVTGDATATFDNGRRVKATVSGTDRYGTVNGAPVYALGVTTVTLVLDSGVLDSSLATVYYGFLDPAHPSFDTTGVNTNTKAGIQSQTWVAFTTGGTSGTYTLTPNPAITSYAAGQRFNVTFNAASAATNTINVSALGAKSLKMYNSAGTKINAVFALNQVADIIYDGTDFVILNILQGGLASPTITSPVIAGTPSGVGTLTSGTAQSLTTAAVNFTSIPSWAKRITIMCTGLSTNGTSPPLIQLGTGATPTYATTGYIGTTDMWQSVVSVTSISSGINLFGTAVAAASTYQGCITLTLMSGNTWFATFVGSQTDSARLALTTASISLSGTLTAIRFYINGTQVFDAGSANIMYE